MGNVIAYSGISTKIRAMQKKLLSEAELKKLSEFRLSVQKAEYLSGFPAYRLLFQNAGEQGFHRMELERRLALSLMQDFDRLYHFADGEQKRFMKLYFQHYEVILVKRSLQIVLSGRPAPFEFTLYEDYIRKYARIDLIRLSQCKDLAEFIEALAGTPYGKLLKRFYESGNAGNADYETAIDMRYFTTMWRLKDKELPKEAKSILERTFGSRIDMLNLNWIYRSKKYFDLTPQEIYSLLIPIRCRISLEEMKKMVEAPGLTEFVAAERETCYGPRVQAFMKQDETLGQAQEALLRHIYRSEARKHPYSIAPINTYFFLKEKEVQEIIRIAEETHYQDKSGQGPVKEVLS